MKEIKLTQGKVALVDDEDFEYLNQFKWYANKSYTTETYYAERTAIISGKKINIRMHRVILGIKNGKIRVDHKDRNGLNNQKENIRTCNASENGGNRKASKNSTSKYLGVSWDKNRQKWRSTIMKNRKQIPLGRFDSEIDAAIAYNLEAVRVHGEFANLNLI